LAAVSGTVPTIGVLGAASSIERNKSFAPGFDPSRHDDGGRIRRGVATRSAIIDNRARGGQIEQNNPIRISGRAQLRHQIAGPRGPAIASEERSIAVRAGENTTKRVERFRMVQTLFDAGFFPRKHIVDARTG